MVGGATPATTSSSDSTSMNEVGKLFGQLFALLLAIIGFESINTTSKEQTLLVRALAFMVTLYYMALVLAAVLQLHVPFMMVTSLLLGSVVAFIALMIISPMVGFFFVGLLMFIFALVLLYSMYQTQIYQMIPEKIKILFERENVEIPVHNFEFQ